MAKGPKNIGFDFFEDQPGCTPQRRVDSYAPFFKIAGTEGAPARFFASV